MSGVNLVICVRRRAFLMAGAAKGLSRSFQRLVFSNFATKPLEDTRNISTRLISLGLGKLAMDNYAEKSKLIDQKIVVLSEKVTLLKQKAANDAVVKRERELEEENEKVKREIEGLKILLKIAEIRNGVPQVALPKIAPTPVTSQKVFEDKPKAGESKSSEPSPPKKPKAEKPKKKTENKKPASGDLPVPVDVSRLDMRIGRIVKVDKHPDADSLYVEEIDTGEEQNRTVLSGLVKFVSMEEMQNRLVIVMMNLKPAKMRGIMSQGMLMCASSPEKVEILIPPPGSVPGDRVVFEGYPGEPDVQLNPKKKIWEQIQPDLRTDQNKVACYKGVPFMIKGKGVVTAPTMADSMIK